MEDECPNIRPGHLCNYMLNTKTYFNHCLESRDIRLNCYLNNKYRLLKFR